MSDAGTAAIAAKLRRVLGVAAVRWESLAHRGYTNNGRWLVALADGRTVFVKAAVDGQTAGWLRAEQRIYAALREPFLPRMLGWDDDGALPVLVLEDLSSAAWPPPWTPAAIGAVRELLRTVAGTRPPPGIRQLADQREALAGWGLVERDPEPLLRLGLCSPAWLDRCLPSLRTAADAAPLAGEALVHGDVRSDNLCLRDGRALLVDWNQAVAGNALFDKISWLPSLHAEGGPLPEELGLQQAPGAPELIALIAGYFAARAGLPPIPHAPRVRDVQREQLKVALPWAARTLGLPPPTT
ncbi:MAG TPA: phosphotransferase [Dehalococcoidia bacterium]|nr:phosphotransferase [Dehalococcoidia bacterium]